MEVCQLHITELFGGCGRLWYPKSNKLVQELSAFRADLAALDSGELEEEHCQCPRCVRASVMRKSLMFEDKECWCTYCAVKKVMQKFEKQEPASRQVDSHSSNPADQLSCVRNYNKPTAEEAW